MHSQLTFTCLKLTIEPRIKLTYFTPFSSGSIVNFEQVNVSWAVIYSNVHENFLPMSYILNKLANGSR